MLLALSLFPVIPLPPDSHMLKVLNFFMLKYLMIFVHLYFKSKVLKADWMLRVCV